MASMKSGKRLSREHLLVRKTMLPRSHGPSSVDLATSQVARVTARPVQGSSVQRELQTVATFDMASSILVRC